MHDGHIILLLVSSVFCLFGFVAIEIKRNWSVPVITDKIVLDQMTVCKIKKLAEQAAKQIA